MTSVITVHPTPDGTEVEIRITEEPHGYMNVVLAPEQAEDLSAQIHLAAYMAKYAVRYDW